MTALKPESLRATIQDAFSAVQYPGNWCLRGSDEGSEPFEIEAAFKGRDDWQILYPGFLNSPKNASALSFFSDEALHFYLPAYLIADIDGLVDECNPSYHLAHGLDNESKDKPINPKRYGVRTWFDYSRYRFSIFSSKEAAAIVAYLEWKKGADGYGRDLIEQALANYWRARGERLPRAAHKRQAEQNRRGFCRHGQGANSRLYFSSKA